MNRYVVVTSGGAKFRLSADDAWSARVRVARLLPRLRPDVAGESIVSAWLADDFDRMERAAFLAEMETIGARVIGCVTS